jgi:hypothetical protein
MDAERNAVQEPESADTATSAVEPPISIAPIAVVPQPAVPEPVPELPPQRIDPFARERATARAAFEAQIEKIRNSRAASMYRDEDGVEKLDEEGRAEIVSEVIFKIGQQRATPFFLPQDHKALIFAACEAAGELDDDGGVMWDHRADRKITDKAQRVAHRRKQIEEWISDALEDGWRAKDHPKLSSQQWYEHEREREKREEADRAEARKRYWERQRLEKLRKEAAAREQERKNREELQRLERELQTADTIKLNSKADFTKHLAKPKYTVDGLMQRGFVYSLTGATGAGKTAIALLLIQAISSTGHRKFGPHEVDKGTVVYFSGENSDDVRMRVKGSDALRKDNPAEDRVYFIDGVFDIKEMRAELETVIAEIGGVNLVVIDTSAAPFSAASHFFKSCLMPSPLRCASIAFSNHDRSAGPTTKSFPIAFPLPFGRDQRQHEWRLM